MSGLGSSPVHITQQPRDAVVLEGHAHTLSVSFSRQAVVQWYKDGEPLPGATNRSLSIAYPLEGDGGAYHALLIRGTNKVPTSIANVTVVPLVRVYAGGQEVTGSIKPWPDQTVELRPWRPGEPIRWTLDGSEPTDLSPLYTIPIVPKDAKVLRMKVGKLEAEARWIRHERPRQTTD